MDFVVGLTRTPSGKNLVWVIINRLTKSSHFLPITNTNSLNKLRQQYIKDIVRLHKISKAIISNIDPMFTSHFWKSLHVALITKLYFNSSYHLQTNGNLSRLFRLWRTCSGLMFWNSRVIGRIKFSWWSLHTIIVFRL